MRGIGVRTHGRVGKALGWRGRSRAVLLAGAGIAALLGGQALAQDDPAEEPADEGTERLVVTGTRIQRSGFNTPTPVTVIDRQSIDDLGIIGAGEILRQLPMNNAEISATTAGQGSLNGYVSDANIGAELPNLRGLNLAFGTRTLTLVDGHRFVPSTNGGAVDVGLIPANLILRTETVTGGASAAYGSDAVAGVINIALDHELVGYRGQIDFAETFVGDGEEKHIGLAGGWELFGGRGHAIAGLEYTDSGAIGQCTQTRDWCRPWAIFENEILNNRNYYLTPNAVGTATPAGTIIDLATTGTFAGAIANYSTMPAAFANMQFNPTGTGLVDWQTGQFVDNLARLMDGGEGVSPDDGVLLRVPVQREALYGRFQYDLTDNITGFVEASYGSRSASNSQATLANSWTGSGTLTGLLIKAGTAANPNAGNPFLPASVNTALIGLTPARAGLYINKPLSSFPDEFQPYSTADNQTSRFVAGLEGSFDDGFLGERSWQWDAYYTYGLNEQEQRFHNLARRSLTGTVFDGLDLNGFEFGLTGGAFANGAYPAIAGDDMGIYGVRNWDLAVDAVRDPADGQIKCRINVPSLRSANQNAVLANPNAIAAGIPELVAQCRPLNVLGDGVGQGQTPDEIAAAMAFALGTQTEDYEYTQHVVGGNAQGEIFDIWTGPVLIAGGFEYRDESGETLHGAPVQYWNPDYGSDFAGSQRIIEGYLETDFSLLRDLPLVQDLAINAAVRRTSAEVHDDTEISITGVRDAEFEFTTWKVSGSWEVSDWLRFRATRSRDVRAPSFRELFFPGRPTIDFGIAQYDTQQDIDTWIDEWVSPPATTPPGAPGSLMGNPWTTAFYGLDPAALAPADWAPDREGSDLPRNGGGNPLLDPEEADTVTLGVVLQAGGVLDGLRVSVDGYQIELTKGIANVYTNGIINTCYFLKDPLACERIVLEPNPDTGLIGDIYSDADENINYQGILTGSNNVNDFRVRGVDLEVLYSFDLDRLVESWNGDLTLRSLTTYMDELFVEGDDRGTLFGVQQLLSFSNRDYSGQVGSGGVDDIASFSESPTWQGNVSGTYNNGPFRTTVQAAWVGEAKLYNDLIGIEDPAWTLGATNSFINARNEVGSYINWTWSGSYNFGLDSDGGRDIEIFGVINNLFDRAPEIAPPLTTGPGANGGGSSSITNPVFYDSLGRRYRVGVRFRF